MVQLVGTDSSWTTLELGHGGTTPGSPTTVDHAEPAGWKLAGYDDSAWSAAYIPVDPPGGWVAIAGADFLSSQGRALGHLQNEIWIARREFTLGADETVESLLTFASDDVSTIWLDGVQIASLGTYIPANYASKHVVTLLPVRLAAGTHCLAVKVSNNIGVGTWADNPTMVELSLDEAVSVGYGWDVYAAATPNGALLETIQNDAEPVEGATKRAIRIELNGAGSGTFKINRNVAVATADVLARGNVVKCRFPWRDGYDFAFLLETGDLTLAAAGEGGGEELTFGGRGIAAYLDRAIMWDQAFTTGLDLADTWTEIWETKNVPKPSGVDVFASDPTYVYVISETTRRVYKLRQSDRHIVATSPALFSGYAAGWCADPADATIGWALEAPWLSGSSAHTKIHKVRLSDWATLATYDLGSAIKHTDIRADGTNLWLTRYDGTTTIYKRSKTTGAVVNSYSISYGGVTQTKANGISVNGTDLAYWFEGTKRALIAAAAAPTVITSKISTHTLVSFGGAWTTEGGNEFFYPVSYVAGVTWKYQIVAATPHDPVDGIWRLDEGTPGAILARLLAEWQAPGRPQQPIPDVSYGFDFANDSSGDPWATNDGTTEFDAKIGDPGLATVLKLIPYGLVVQMQPDLTLIGDNASTYGTDRSSATFAAGKVRFEKGVNIAPELLRRAHETDQHSDMLAGGGGNLFETAAEHDLGYTREGFISTQLTDPTALEGTAVATLSAERVIAEKIALRVVAGDDESVGLYRPFTHYNVGDVVRIHTGTGETDLNERDFLIYAMTLEENDAGDFPTPVLELGSAFLPDASSAAGGATAGSSGGGSSGGAIIADANVTLEGLDETGAVTSSAIGRTIRSADWSILQDVTGVIRVVLTSIGRLLGLSDVDADGITDGQGLAFDAASGTFIPADFSTGSGGPFYDVRDYGATLADGSDETADIQTAIDAAHTAGGGIVWLPGPEYGIGAAGLVLYPDVGLLGPGRDSCKLLALADGINVITESGTATDSTYEINHATPVEGIEISANGHTGCNGLSWIGVAYTAAKRCTFRGFTGNGTTGGIGLDLYGSLQSAAVECKFLSNTVGVAFTKQTIGYYGGDLPPNLVWLDRCTFYYNVKHAIDYSGGQGLGLADCELGDNGTAGDATTGAIKVRVTGDAGGPGLVTSGITWLEANHGYAVLDLGATTKTFWKLDGFVWAAYNDSTYSVALDGSTAAQQLAGSIRHDEVALPATVKDFHGTGTCHLDLEWSNVTTSGSWTSIRLGPLGDDSLVEDLSQWLALRLPNLTTTQRNAIAAPTAGMVIWNTTTATVQRYSGSAWADVGAAGALDDLTDVTITTPAAGDRLRFNGSAWVNSALIWAPVMVLDPASGNYLVLTDTTGDPIMAEV